MIDLDNNFNIQCSKICFEDYYKDAYDKLGLFAKYLVEEGEIRGLIGPREVNRIWERHILNCATVAKLIIPKTGDILVDVGSGAGLPGIVLACLFPDLKIVLVESMQRRVDWLEYIAEKLKLTNVDVVRGRAEEVVKQYGGSAKYVTARAVANLSKLLKWTIPFLEDGGKLLALKGEKAEEELKDASKLLQKMNIKKVGTKYGKVHNIKFCEESEPTNIVEITRLDLKNKEDNKSKKIK